MDVTMSTVLDLIEEKGYDKGKEDGFSICYINCRKRNMSAKDAQMFLGLSDKQAF